MCRDNEEWYKIWRGIYLSVKNCHEVFDEFWPDYSKISQKKYRGVLFDSAEDWCKIWRKTDLCFLKWHEKFGKSSLTGWKLAVSF